MWGMMTLAQYLTREKMTQAEFAKRIAVNQGTVSKLCADKKNKRPSWKLAARIAAATGGEVPVSVWTPDMEETE
jgi:DNA-binding XRE family transcriptional regulator